nr:hypothetical protein [Tanacetum cinerariifolium]
MLPFRMARLQFSKCIGDKVRVVLVRDLRAMLQAQGVTRMWVLQQLIRQELSVVIIVRVRGIWLDNALNQKCQGMLNGEDTSNCDEAPSAKEMLRAYLSSYDLDVISEVSISDTYPDNFVLDHYVQEMYYSEQPAFNPALDTEITNNMSRDVLTVGSTMRIPLLYRGEYSQWVERFMNYLKEQTDGEAMINSIKNDRKAAVLYEYETFKATKGELLLDTYIRYLQVINDLKKCDYLKDNCELNFKLLNNLQPEWKQYATMMRQNKNLMDINIDALYNILNELKKITALLAKAFNRRKFYSNPTNNNLRTSSTSQSANKKQEFVKTDNKKVEKKDDEKKRDMSRVKCYNCKKEGHFAKDCKKVKVKDYEYYKTKMLLAKKDKDEQVLLAEDQAWMESSSDSDQEINASMVFMAQIKKVLSNSEASSSSADEKISEVSYYLSESESESEFETSEYYDNSTDYGLFVNNDDDQEIFHDAIESASENFIKNHIESKKDYDKSDVDHTDSEEKDHLVDKLIRKFNKKIVKCQKRIEKANQQIKDFENQNKDLQDKYDVLKNQATTFEMNNKELNEQLKGLIKKNNDFFAQTKLLKEQLQVKHVVIDIHAECQEKYAKLEAERYEYMIRYSAYFDNDKQHRKQIADHEVLYDKMSVQLVELDKH